MAGCVDVGHQSVEDVDSAVCVAGGVDRVAVQELEDGGADLSGIRRGRRHERLDLQRRVETDRLQAATDA